MVKSGKRKLGTPCVYCGIRPSTRKGDHVVPKALFTEPFPSDMVTVPACPTCNMAKEPLDSYLRDTLVTDIAVSSNPIARQLVTGKLARCIADNRSPFIREAIPGARWKPMFSSSGIYVGHGVSVPVDDRKIRHELRFMVRGLYYWVRDQRIPDSYQFEVERIDTFHVGDAWDMLAGKSEGAGQIGNNVFACRYMFGLEDGFVSYWLLIFYNAIAYGVMSVPPGGLAQSQAVQTLASAAVR
jgi:hypothetical protein